MRHSPPPVSPVISLASHRTDPSDAELVAGALAGRTAAVEALFRRHFRDAHGLAFVVLGHDRDLEDVVQESMASALAELPRLREPRLFRAWLAKHVVFQARRVLRKRRLLSRLGLASYDTNLDMLVSASAPGEIVIELRMVARALERLEPRQRIALALRLVEGYEIEEIAELMGTSASSIKRWLRKGSAVLDEIRGGRPQEAK